MFLILHIKTIPIFGIFLIFENDNALFTKFNSNNIPTLGMFNKDAPMFSSVVFSKYPNALETCFCFSSEHLIISYI